MRGRWRWTVGLVLAAGAADTAALAAQAEPDVCALATSEEFQRAHGLHPTIGLLPDDPVKTEMVWGPHCDYADGSIDLFTKKSPKAELERVLKLTEAPPQRSPVPGLGQGAFFTLIYPNDQYRRRGFLAIPLGSRILTISMDPPAGESLEATRPKLEALARLVLPRLK